MENLKQDVRELNVKMDKIMELSVRNTVSLEEHMKRTDLNETRIEKIEYYILGILGSCLLAVLSKLL